MRTSFRPDLGFFRLGNITHVPGNFTRSIPSPPYQLGAWGKGCFLTVFLYAAPQDCLPVVLNCSAGQFQFSTFPTFRWCMLGEWISLWGILLPNPTILCLIVAKWDLRGCVVAAEFPFRTILQFHIKRVETPLTCLSLETAISWLCWGFTPIFPTKSAWDNFRSLDQAWQTQKSFKFQKIVSTG